MNDTEISATVATLLFGLGAFLKNATPLKNEWIPGILFVIGMAATLAFTKDLSPGGWVRAVMTALAATGAHSSTQSTVAAVKAGTLTDPKPTA